MGQTFKNIVVVLAGCAILAGCGKSGNSGSSYQPRKVTNGYAETGAGPNAPGPVPQDQQVPQDPQTDDNQVSTTPTIPQVKPTVQSQNGNQNGNGIRTQNKTLDSQKVIDPIVGDVNTVSDEVVEDLSVENSPVEVLGNAHQCGEAYKNTEPEWLPGTLFPPAQTPIYTGGETPRGYKYTDSHDDSVMAILAEDFRRRVTGCRVKPSLELAQRISYVDVFTDIYDKGEARVSFELFDGSVRGAKRSQKQKIVIHMMGSFGGKMTATRQPLVNGNGKMVINLVQTNKAKEGLKFRGYLGCLDADFGCQTTVIVLEQLTRDGKVCRTAFAVHRNGNAHITMHPNDREVGRLHDNNNYAQLSDFLANTADAACFQNLRDIENDVRRAMPQCAIQRMRQQCANVRIQEPYARIVSLKTWSVLYGAAKFKFQFDDFMKIEGPLVYSKIRPVIESQRIAVSGISGIKHAYLVNNDGAGQLNFGLKFKGQPEETMRITVSSILKDSLYGNERMKVVKTVSEQTPKEEYVTDEGQVVTLPGQPYDPDKEFSIDTQKSDTVVDGDSESAAKDPRATQNDPQKK